MSESEKHAVRVTIFGEEYSLRSEADEEHTLACARYVDDAIRDAHLQSHVSEPHRAAILAALEITDELFRLRREQERRESRMTERIESLERRVEQALG